MGAATLIPLAIVTLLGAVVGGVIWYALRSNRKRGALEAKDDANTEMDSRRAQARDAVDDYHSDPAESDRLREKYSRPPR